MHVGSTCIAAEIPQHEAVDTVKHSVLFELHEHAVQPVKTF